MRHSALTLLAVLALALPGCTGLQNWKESVEQKAASNSCNDAGWTEATGRHQECIANTRAAMIQQQRQDTQELIAGGVAVAALSGLYRQPTPVAEQGSRRAALVAQRYENYQWVCQYQTEAGVVQVVGPGSCAPEYFY